MIDFDRDGKQDLLARYPDGGMRLFRSTGANSFMNEPRPMIGSGWQVMNAASVSYDFTSAGSRGLVSREASTGILYHYPISTRTWGTRTQLSGHWDSLIIAD